MTGKTAPRMAISNFGSREGVAMGTLFLWPPYNRGSRLNTFSRGSIWQWRCWAATRQRLRLLLACAGVCLAVANGGVNAVISKPHPASLREILRLQAVERPSLDTVQDRVIERRKVGFLSTDAGAE